MKNLFFILFVSLMLSCAKVELKDDSLFFKQSSEDFLNPEAEEQSPEQERTTSSVKRSSTDESLETESLETESLEVPVRQEVEQDQKEKDPFLVKTDESATTNSGEILPVLEVKEEPTEEESLLEDFSDESLEHKQSSSYKNIFKTSKIDLVLVLDSSKTLNNHRKELLHLTKKLIEDSLKSSSWRLGVLSAQLSKDKGILKNFSDNNNYIDSKTTDPLQKIEEIFNSFSKKKTLKSLFSNPMDFFSSDQKKYLEASSLSLKMNPSFFRENASIVFLVMSLSKETPSMTQTDFLSHFEDKQVSLYSLSPLNEDCRKKIISTLPRKSTVQTGRNHNPFPENENERLVSVDENLIELSKNLGKAYSLCEDKSALLSDLLVQTSSYGKAFKLSHKAIPDSVKISLSPHDPSLTWNIDKKDIIRFSKVPNPGTVIRVIFKTEEN